MKVVYTAPNRGHHFTYAIALNKVGLLFKFVSGLSRFNKYVDINQFENKFKRVDLIQNIYLISLRLKLSPVICNYLAYKAKVEQDTACKKIVINGGCDIFLFYSGSGLNTCKVLKSTANKCIKIVEAVNSHVVVQENILRKEYEMLGLNWHPFLKLETERRMQEYELADYILLPSEFVKNSFIKMGFPEDKLLKVPYGFKMNQASLDLFHKENNGKFIVLYVGSISVRKGIRYLIQAFEKLTHPHKELILVGPMTSETGIEDLQLPIGVVFTGVLKGTDLECAYLKADIFCLPTLEEGLALVLGEALSFGLPVITTVNSGAEDIIENGVEGFILPIRDVELMKEKMQLFADDSNMLLNFRNAAITKSKSSDGWIETEKKLVSELKKCYHKKSQLL